MKAIKKPIVVDFEIATEDGEVEVLGGKVTYKKGDAIITGVKGERYPCRRDIFDQTYSITYPSSEEEKIMKFKIEIRNHNVIDVLNEKDEDFCCSMMKLLFNDSNEGRDGMVTFGGIDVVPNSFIAGDYEGNKEGLCELQVTFNYSTRFRRHLHERGYGMEFCPFCGAKIEVEVKVG